MRANVGLLETQTTELDYSERARREREQRFLADAGEALASSLDYHATLGMVAPFRLSLARGSLRLR